MLNHFPLLYCVYQVFLQFIVIIFDSSHSLFIPNEFMTRRTWHLILLFSYYILIFEQINFKGYPSLVVNQYYFWHLKNLKCSFYLLNYLSLWFEYSYIKTHYFHSICCIHNLLLVSDYFLCFQMDLFKEFCFL